MRSFYGSLYREWGFPLQISSVKNLQQFSTHLVTYTEEVLNGKFHFLCGEFGGQWLRLDKISHSASLPYPLQYIYIDCIRTSKTAKPANKTKATLSRIILSMSYLSHADVYPEFCQVNKIGLNNSTGYRTMSRKKLSYVRRKLLQNGRSWPAKKFIIYQRFKPRSFR